MNDNVTKFPGKPPPLPEALAKKDPALWTAAEMLEHVLGALRAGDTAPSALLTLLTRNEEGLRTVEMYAAKLSYDDALYIQHKLAKSL